MFVYSHKEKGGSLGIWLSSFIFLLACIGQLYLIFSYSIDFPFSDEWDYFNSYKIPTHFDLSWLFRRYNSHYVISEHLLLWIHYKINSLNFKIHQLTNFIFFSLFVFSFFRISKKLYIKKTPIIISLIFLYSCVAWEIHVWANCSSCYLFYLYGLWALYLSTLPSISFKE